MTSLTSMHHPTYYQVMLEQGAQIDVVNQQPTRISTSSLSFQEPPLIGTGYQSAMFLPIAVVMLGPYVRLPHLHHFGYVCTTDSRLRRVEHQV
jgi:hypothetical protein